MNIYDIKFTEQELALVFAGLAKLPYEASASFIHALQAKIQEAHDNAARVKADADAASVAAAVTEAKEEAAAAVLRGD